MKPPFKFNGKELDAETGLYYYGARYYDARTSIWLSVDPMANNTPNFNPYVYCEQNPVNLVDPDGRKSDPPPSVWKRIGGGLQMVGGAIEAVVGVLAVSLHQKRVLVLL